MAYIFTFENNKIMTMNKNNYVYLQVCSEKDERIDFSLRLIDNIVYSDDMKNSIRPYTISALFLLFTAGVLLYVRHFVYVHSFSLWNPIVVLIAVFYLLSTCLFVIYLYLRWRQRDIQLIQNTINKINRTNGIQYLLYEVKQRKFYNLNDSRSREYLELTPDKLYAVTYPTDISIAKEMVERLNTGVNENMRYEYRLKSSSQGTYSWRLVNICPCKINSKGEVTCYVATALYNENSHDMMKTIELFNKKILYISNINNLIFVQYDRATKVYTRLDAVGTGVSHQIPMDYWLASFYPDDLHEAKQLLDFMDGAKGEKYHTEYRYKYPADDYKWFSVDVGAYERNEDGEILTYLCMTMDIDENKRNLEEEKVLRRKADAANQLKSQFLMNVSHEIRTPLNAIVGFSNLIDKDTTEKELAMYKNIIESNNNQLLNIIDNALNKSLIETGFASVSLVQVDLRKMLEKKVKTFTEEGKKRGLTVKGEYDEKNILLNTDGDWISKIIDALIANAFNFTSLGSVVLGYQIDGNSVRIFVKDTGIGIANEDQIRIFDNFEKVNVFSMGLGMGLSMCKSAVTRLGGTIGVESQLGKGSCFWFRLPILG